MHLWVDVCARADFRLKLFLGLYMFSDLLLIVMLLQVHLVLQELIVVEVVGLAALLHIRLVLQGSPPYLASGSHFIRPWARLRLLLGRVPLRRLQPLGCFRGPPVSSRCDPFYCLEVWVIRSGAQVCGVLADIYLLADVLLLLLNELLLEDLCFTVYVQLLLLLGSRIHLLLRVGLVAEGKVKLQRLVRCGLTVEVCRLRGICG